MFKEYRVLNKNNNEDKVYKINLNLIQQGQTEKQLLNLYVAGDNSFVIPNNSEFGQECIDNYVIIPIDNYKYVYNKEIDRGLRNIEEEVSKAKIRAHEINKNKHMEFLNTPITIILNRDITGKSDIVFILDGTDSTRSNIQTVVKIAEDRGNVYYYDNLGNGDILSLEEIKQVAYKLLDVVDPSFIKKGNNKFSINKANSVSEIEDIVNNINY